MEPDIEKEKIIYRELERYNGNWNASTQRTGIYRARGVKEDKKDYEAKKRSFKAKMIAWVQVYIYKIIELYRDKDRQIDDSAHIRNIKAIKEQAKVFDNDLGILSSQKNPSKNKKKHGYSFGVAQKLLNLLLKHMWAEDEILEPPHCPIDRNVIGEIPKGIKDENTGNPLENISWTGMGEKQYRQIIGEIKKVAKNKGQTIAEWELILWNEFKKSQENEQK